MRSLRLVAIPFALLALASPILLDCGGTTVVVPAPELSGCDEMKSGDFSKIDIEGGPAVDAKVRGFLDATFGLQKAAGDMETELVAACAELGKGIGLGDADLTATPGGGKAAETVCNNVAAKITAILKANPDAQFNANIETPHCYADVGAIEKCLDACGSPVKGGDMKASCQGGEITGQCAGTCKGTCTVGADAACTGSCKGTCNGKCDSDFSGTCGGKCTGLCDGKKVTGACKGTCEGKCDGKGDGLCGGVCGGACSANCDVKGEAKCDGSCAGGCSEDVKSPRCTGDYKPANVDPGCQAGCGAKGAIAAKCDLPFVRLTVKGKLNDDGQKLAAALKASLPRIAAVQYGGGVKIGVGLAAIVKGAVDLKDPASKAGSKPGACVSTAATAAGAAATTVRINVQASGSVSTAVNATAAAKGG